MTLSHRELAERAYRAFRENDVEALPAIYHPEVALSIEHWEGFPETGPLHGHEGAEELLQMLRGIFGEFDIRLVKFTEIGEDRAFLEVALTLEGKSSGVGLDVSLGQIVEFRDGLIYHVETYYDEDKARRDAGLAEGREA